MKKFMLFNLLAYLLINMLLIEVAHSFINGYNHGLNSIKMKISRETKLSSAYTVMASRKLTNDEIIETVADFFETTPGKITRTGSRYREEIFPYQIAIWFCVNNNIKNSPDKDEPNYKWKQLARQFNKKNHATIIYNFRTIENLIETDKKVKPIIDVISRNIELKTRTIKDHEKINN